MLYVKKRLSPLKKGLTVEPKVRATSGGEKKHMKITFFNVEKLNLVKMYEELGGGSESNSPEKMYDDEDLER